MIEIDGAKNPELIPEYLVWQSGFHTLKLLKDNNVPKHEGPLASLTLSDADAALLHAEVERFHDHKNRCEERGQRIVLAHQGQEIEVLERAMKANTLQCRVATLESKDRLLANMTPEGQVTLTMWMLNERPKMKAIVGKSDLEFFRQPR
jgi:hypothetical protein